MKMCLLARQTKKYWSVSSLVQNHRVLIYIVAVASGRIKIANSSTSCGIVWAFQSPTDDMLILSFVVRA